MELTARLKDWPTAAAAQGAGIVSMMACSSGAMPLERSTSSTSVTAQPSLAEAYNTG